MALTLDLARSSSLNLLHASSMHPGKTSEVKTMFLPSGDQMASSASVEILVIFFGAPLAAKGLPIARPIIETMVLAGVVIVIMLSHRRGAIAAIAEAVLRVFVTVTLDVEIDLLSHQTRFIKCDDPVAVRPQRNVVHGSQLDEWNAAPRLIVHNRDSEQVLAGGMRGDREEQTNRARDPARDSSKPSVIHENRIISCFSGPRRISPLSDTFPRAQTGGRDKCHEINSAITSTSS